MGADLKTRKEILAQAIERFREVAPFVDEGIEGVFPPVGTPKDLDADTKQTDPWTIVRGPIAVEQPPGGAYPRGRFSTPIKNLLQTGPATLPGLGYEGELISGVAVGRRALRQVKN
jgi:phytoene dehydrogenase-like protein